MKDEIKTEADFQAEREAERQAIIAREKQVQAEADHYREIQEQKVRKKQLAKSVNFQSPNELREWWGYQLIEISKKLTDTSPATKINSMSKGIDTWLRCYKAEKELATVEDLEKAVEELRRHIMSGPAGIVQDGSQDR